MPSVQRVETTAQPNEGSAPSAGVTEHAKVVILDREVGLAQPKVGTGQGAWRVVHRKASIVHFLLITAWQAEAEEHSKESSALGLRTQAM